MPYREPADRSARTLDVRPDPPLFALLGGGAALLFVAIGLWLLAALVLGARSSHTDGAGSAALIIGGMGICFTGVGSLFLTVCVRSLTTVVRFTLEEDEVTIDWRRRGAVVKREVLARADLVDVSVTDDPGSGGGHTHALVVTTRSGVVTLSTVQNPRRRYYEVRRDALAAFLGIPAST